MKYVVDKRLNMTLTPLYEWQSSRHSTSIIWELLRAQWYIPSISSEVISSCMFYPVSRDSSVGIATRYGLDGPGIESR